MANGYNSGGQTAPYPANGYPGVNFFGAGQAGRFGIASGQSMSSTPSGRGGGALSSVLPPGLMRNHLVAILVVVGVGYGLFHWSARV